MGSMIQEEIFGNTLQALSENESGCVRGLPRAFQGPQVFTLAPHRLPGRAECEDFCLG